MVKVQNFAGVPSNLPFTSLIFMLRIEIRAKLGRRPYFLPEGKVALMFLKMYTGLSSPKLMEQWNGNINYLMFCDAKMDQQHLPTN